MYQLGARVYKTYIRQIYAIIEAHIKCVELKNLPTNARYTPCQIHCR